MQIFSVCSKHVDRCSHFSRFSLHTRFGAGLIRPTTLKPSVHLYVVDSPTISLREESLLIPQEYDRSRAFKHVAKHAFNVLSIAITISTISCPPAYAVKAASGTVEHLHAGQKIANYFRSFGIPDLAILAIISAMPVVELRGAVPVGVWMGLPIQHVLPVCVLGNMAPIIPILLLLRNDKLK